MEKLKQIVHSLDGHEQKAFAKYLQSPFFTTNPALEKAFNQLQKSSHPGEKVMMTARLSSEMTYHLENFLAIRHLQRQPYAMNLARLQSLADHDSAKAWQYAWHELKNSEHSKDATYHLTMSIAHENEISYLATMQSRKKEADYRGMMDHLDAYYCSKKLQFCCEVLNRKSLLAASTEMPFLQQLIHSASSLLKHHAVAVYYHILHTFTDAENESHFEEARKSIIDSEKKFSTAEYASCIAYLKNYCIRRMNRGDQKYASILFDIYKSTLSSSRLLRADYLSQFEFKNIVSLSLRLNESDWCREFIRKYSYHLPPDVRKNAITYNTAYFHFINKNFRLAIRMLRDVEFTDVVYQLDARVVLLKSYYELHDQETFFYHASAFRLFLLRNRYLSESHKNMNRNLIKYLTRMLRDQYSGLKVQRLKSEISQVTDVADLRWLKEKADEL